MKAIAAKGEDEATDINISPLIDMVFILLIFFIVTTVFVEESGLDIDTPDIVPPKEKIVTEPFILRIDEVGSVFYKDEEIGTQGVSTYIKNAQAMGELESVTIEIHPNASMQVATYVLGLCSDGSIERVNLKTAPTE